MAGLLRSAFHNASDGHNGSGKRPVVFDIIAPDGHTSLLPEHLKMVLHVNPSSFKPTFTKKITRVQTLGGFVEQHWGDGVTEITMEMATGGFMRLYAGLMSATGGPFAHDIGGTRRETIAYDKYLDMLALFKNNGAVYDARGNIAMQGKIKISFDGESHIGWFNSFSVSESAGKPYQFGLSAGFTVEQSNYHLRTTSALAQPTLAPTAPRTASSAAVVYHGGTNTNTSPTAARTGAVTTE